MGEGSRRRGTRQPKRAWARVPGNPRIRHCLAHRAGTVVAARPGAPCSPHLDQAVCIPPDIPASLKQTFQLEQTGVNSLCVARLGWLHDGVRHRGLTRAFRPEICPSSRQRHCPALQGSILGLSKQHASPARSIPLRRAQGVAYQPDDSSLHPLNLSLCLQRLPRLHRSAAPFLPLPAAMMRS